jgi:hypothetical protein
MIAASIVLYVGLGIIIAATLRSRWTSAHPIVVSVTPGHLRLTR